jgi:hypothetical protein
VWTRLVRRPRPGGWLLQDYVEPMRMATGRRVLYQDLSVCLADGDVVGYCSRLSTRRKTNIAQGAAKQPVFVAGSPP